MSNGNSYLENMARGHVGQQMIAAHVGQMNAMSEAPAEAIDEIPGFDIVYDGPYQGFDNAPELGYSAPRFWCRSITVRRSSDGAMATGRGPQADAYESAVWQILNGVK